MLRAVDLHLHSRHADAVSPAMTLVNIAVMAQVKGLDVLSTGDCLQPDWREELRETLLPAEPGLWRLNEATVKAVAERVRVRLRRELRFVLGTEVCCAPPGTPELGGLHHLVYFSSLEDIERFSEKIVAFGDLRAGRPTLALDSRELLERVLALETDARVIPAHVFNPWYSALGTLAGSASLEAIFGDLTPRLTAVETGLTSTPPMCRRVGSLDPFNLVASSDAHSLEKLGRECTLLEFSLDYAGLFAAVAKGPAGQRMIKYPLERTRYYRNRCTQCQRSHRGQKCPDCGRSLVSGSHDRLEAIATRAEPAGRQPEFLELLPLRELIAELQGVDESSASVKRLVRRVLEALGSERSVLTEASFEQLAEVGTATLARAIVHQRTVTPGAKDWKRAAEPEAQLSLGV